MIYKLKLETITPLFIGSNDFLSPATDYFFLDNKVFYLSLTKLIDLFPNDKTDIFLQEFYKTFNSDKSYYESNVHPMNFQNSLLSSLVSLFSDTHDLISVSKYFAPCNVNPEGRIIRKFISSSGKIFIPGSSIKGMIKTAILYDFLKNTKNGQETLEVFQRKVGVAAREFTGRLKEITYLEQLRKSEKNIRNKTGIKHRIDNITNPVRQKIGKIIKILETDLFGSDPDYDFMRQVIISDSNRLPLPECIQIYEIKRLRLNDKKTIGAPLIAELVKEDSSFEFTIKLEPFNNTLINREYFEQLNMTKLLQMVDDFSRDQVKYELNLFGNDRYLSNIILFNKSISNSGAGDILFRLGGNKSFLFNTITSLLPDKYFKLLREIMRIGENPFTGELVRSRFPSTQRFIVNRNEIKQQPGWCTLKIL